MLNRARGFVVLVAFGLVAGGLASQPASATADASSSPTTVARTDPSTVPPLPSAKRDLAGELNTPVAGVNAAGKPTAPTAADTAPQSEIVGLRSEGSETYSTNSQMKVTRFYAEPRWYKDSAGAWQRVNNNVVDDPTRPGVLQNAGAAWTASFQVAGSGVDLQVGGQDVNLGILGDPTVTPTKDPQDSTVVWYRAIRPGVDLKFQISATGLEESWVVSNRQALAAGGFASGLTSTAALVPDATFPGSQDFDWNGNGKSAFDGDTDGPKVRIMSPEVVDSSGMSIAAAKPALTVGSSTAPKPGLAVQPVGVNVDPSVALSLTDAQFPVTVDPQVQIVPSSMGGSWASYNQGGNLSTGSNQWGLLGNWRIFNGDDRWRFDIAMGYSYLWTNIAPNARVFSANMQLDMAQYPTAVAPTFDTQWASFPTSSTATQVNVCQANAWSYAGAYPGYGGCTDWYNYGYAPAASAMGGYPGTTYVDVTSLLRPWVATHNPNGVFGVSLDDLANGVYDFKATIPSMQVVWDQPSPAAALVGPADGSTIATSTPTLSVGAVTDPDSGQNPPMYSATIYAGQPSNLANSDPTSNCQANSAIWSSNYVQNQTNFTVPAGVLQDGVTYYWSMATVGTYPGYPTCAGPWKFKVDSRLGSDRPYPTQTVGPFTVNAATGNLIASAGSHTVASVGGDIGPSFSYNSQAPFQNGLRASFYGGTPPLAHLNPALTFAQPSFAQRIDPQINFNWSTKGPTSDADLDNWLGQWTGYVTVPSAGSYCFGTNADDGSKVYIGGTLVMSNWVDHTAGDNQCTTAVTFAAGETKSITVQYYDHTGAASIQLKVYSAPAGVPTGVVPSGWLSPELHPLGPGWTMAAGEVSVSGARMSGSGITLIRSDGTTVEYAKNATGAYVGPASDATRVRVDAVSGDIQVDDDSGTSYHFASDGSLRSAVSATDDRNPSATQYVWSGNPVRMTGMVDPVSNKTVTMSYGGDAACTTPPTGFVIAPGQLCQVKSWDGQSTDLFYNSNLQLARIVNPGGVTTDYGYGSNNHITSVRDSTAFDVEFNDTLAATQRTDDTNLRWSVVYDASGRVDHITSPAPVANTPSSEQTTTFHYNSVATSTTYGETTVNVSGVSEPNGYSAKLHFDDSLRLRETYDVAARLTQTTYDGVSDRVSYSDTNVGTAQAMRSSTIYDTSVVFNNLSRPTDTYGPAPVSMFNGPVPASGQSGNVAHSQTRYDESINGLQAAWWDDTPGQGETYSYPNRPAFRGAPKLHTIVGATGTAFWNWGTTSPDSLLPNDNFSGRLTGLVYLSTAGNWTFSGQADDGLIMTIDDQQAVNTWTTPLAKVVSPAMSLAAGWHQISVDFREDTGGASLELWYTPPGGSETIIPSTSLKPDLGLVTTTIDPNNISTTTGYQNPLTGLPTTSTQDPGGLGLTSTTTYESPGSGWLRRTNRALPADASQSRNTSTYTPYGASENNPAVTCAGTIGAIGTRSQRGLPHLTRDADPTTAGGTGGITREQVQDDAGRVVASRVSTDTKWSCVAFDSRGRPTTKTYPAGGGQAERTVTYNYGVNGDPLLSSVTDPSGTITTRVDVLGRTTDSQDVWGTITHTDYDGAGRPTQSTVFTTSGAVIERSMSDYAATGSGVGQQAAVRWSNAAATVSGYTSANLWATTAMPTVTGTTLDSVTFDSIGRATSDTYASGVQSATGFDAYQRPNSLADTKSATTITSDSVTRDLTGRVTDESVDGTDANPSGPNYAYDSAGRLTDWYVRDPSSGNITHGNYNYTYTQGTPSCSSNGWFEPQAGRDSNRLEARTQVNGGTWSTTSYCYDHADRLRAVNPPAGTPNPYSTIAYDAHGNTSQYGGETLLYDGADRHIGTTNATTPTALLVVGDPSAMSARDSWMKQRLTDAGWSVVVEDDDVAVAGDATGKQLVIVTDSVAISNVATTFKTVAVPVVVSELIYANMGMVPTGSDQGTTTNADQTQVTVTSAGAASPIGAGLKPGATTVSNSQVKTIWGKPNANATVVATVPSDPTEAAIFGYDTGAVMPGLAAPARRVGWWQYSGTPDNPTNGALFDAVVAWAARTTPKLDYTRDVTDRIVSRSVNSHVEEKYSYTATGDTSDLTLDPSGNVTEATLALPGGALYTWRATAPVWSYPNLHGDVAALTDASGTKSGPTQAFDPYGQSLTTATAGELDNSAGQFDYGWEGKAQRPTEHQSGTLPLIEMGARPYDPGTGRFLRVDSVEGGTANDYTYVTDPINNSDLSGNCSKSSKACRKPRKRTYCPCAYTKTVSYFVGAMQGTGAVGGGINLAGIGSCGCRYRITVYDFSMFAVNILSTVGNYTKTFDLLPGSHHAYYESVVSASTNGRAPIVPVFVSGSIMANPFGFGPQNVALFAPLIGVRIDLMVRERRYR